MTLRRFLTIFLASSTVLSCGFKGPKAKEQSSSHIIGPEFDPSSNVFHFVDDGTELTDGDKDHQYDGSLILWNENAKPSLVSQVIDLSTQGKIYKNAYFEKIAEIDPILAAKNKEQKNLEDLEEQAKHSDTKLLETKAYEKQSGKLLISADTWVKAQILPGKTIQFQNYCDMNLLEFAVSPFLYQNTFTKVPLASGLCAEYYASQGLLTGPSCTAASLTEVGNYFRCYWEEGVLKRFTITNGTVADFINAFPDFLQWLKDNEERVDIRVLKLGNAGAHYKIKSKSTSLILPKYNVNKGVSDFLDKGDKNPEFKYFIAMQSKRTAKEGSKYSFNDRLFNFHFIQDEKNVPSLNEKDSTELHQVQTERPQVFGPQIIIDDPILDKIQESKQQIATYDAKMRKVRDEASKPFDDFMNNDTAAAKLIINNQLAHTMISQITLDMTPDENVVRVEIKFPPTPQKTPRTIVGCFDWESGKPDTCSSAGQVPTSREANISFNKSSGQILLTYLLAEPTEVGFNTVQKDPYIQNIPKDQLINKTLWMELYPRKFKTHLDVITGTVKILDNEQIVFQGSLSFATRILTDRTN